MSQIRSSLSWGIAPLLVGVLAPSLGCSSKAEKQTYDPVPLGMVSTDAAFYDDGQTTIYQVKRPVSIPMILPNADEKKALRQIRKNPRVSAGVGFPVRRDEGRFEGNDAGWVRHSDLLPHFFLARGDFHTIDPVGHISPAPHIKVTTVRTPLHW